MTTSLAERRSIQAVLDQYSLILKACHRSGQRYRVFTNLGPFALYATRLGEQSIRFTFLVTEHLVASGFGKVCRIVCTGAGIPWVQQGDRLYYLCDQPWGDSPRADNPPDVRDSVQLLAQLHQAGVNLPPSPFDRVRAGGLPELLQARVEELRLLRDQAVASKKSLDRRFDRKFVEYADDFIALGQTAQASLASSPYAELVEIAVNQRQLCHRNYGPANLIRTVGGDTRVTGFHRAAVDLRVMDLARLCATLGGWNARRIGELIRDYDTVNPLHPGEFEVLLAWLRFPREFWWVAHSHYVRETTHREWLKELGHTAVVREMSLVELSREVDSMEETPYRERFIPVTWESLDDPVPELQYQSNSLVPAELLDQAKEENVTPWPLIGEELISEPVYAVAAPEVAEQAVAAPEVVCAEPVSAEPAAEVESPLAETVYAVAAPEVAELEAAATPSVLAWRPFPAPLKRGTFA